MKLYTEEQVLDAISKAFRYKSNVEILKSLNPIELPSDEEIEKEALDRHTKFNSFIVRFKFFNEGAKWE